MPTPHISKQLALSALLLVAGTLPMQAKVVPQKPVHLVRVEGVVVNLLGEPLAGAELTLEHDGIVSSVTRTDAAGRFAFDHVRGDFFLHLARTQYAAAVQEVIVGDDLVVRAEHKKIYIVAGPGACEDECSAVTTDKREFKKTLKRKSRR